VTVPEHEGRAGMAAIQLKKEAHFDPQAFYLLAEQKLPQYAIPLFVRVSEQSDLTSTFKLRKVELQQQGYDPENFEDPLFVMDKEKGSYLPFSAGTLEKLGVELSLQRRKRQKISS